KLVADVDEAQHDSLALSFESVVIDCGARHLAHLDSIVDPLVVTDLATVVWAPHGHHEAVDALLAHAQIVLLDSVDEPEPGDAIELEPAPEQSVRGLASVEIETASGRWLRLSRGPGGLHAEYKHSRGTEREWTVLGASRGEAGILGEGIRQALLRDQTYAPAL